MSLCVWAPRRPHPASAAGTVLSMFAHAAAVAAVVVVQGPASARADAESGARAGVTTRTRAGEELHWVGVGGRAGREGAVPRAGARPPVAYVIPGRGGLRYQVWAGDASRSRAPAARPGRHPASGGAGRAPHEAPSAARRPRQRARALAIPSLPDLSLADAEATLLVAGVLASAPDLARGVSRPEDFLPLPTGGPPPNLRARRGAHALSLLAPMTRVDDLPIPLVSNPPPAYPAMLERARVGGRVVVEFVIDSAGRIDLGSLRVVQSTNRQFTQAVRRVLPSLRFLPAQLERRAVRVAVRQPFEFRIAADR